MSITNECMLAAALQKLLESCTDGNLTPTGEPRVILKPTRDAVEKARDSFLKYAPEIFRKSNPVVGPDSMRFEAMKHNNDEGC